jgi:tRNA pseudouridine38-40 synthase
MARRNFLLVLAYDGSLFRGWQRLGGGGRSVQGELERALSEALGARIEVVGAGRTDAGVHAEGQAASFHAFTSLSCGEIAAALNARLPRDLSCRSCAEVDARFHARLHARSKVYRYRLIASGESDAEAERFGLRVSPGLDLEAMRRVGRALVGERDFRALSNAKGEDTLRRLDEVRVEASPRRGGVVVDLFFVGPGFLYNQVRVMAGLLVEAGRGEAGPSDAAALLAGASGPRRFGALPPRGLCLVEVRYERAGKGADGGKSKDGGPAGGYPRSRGRGS